MVPAAERILNLRQLLADRFELSPVLAEKPYLTGVPVLDAIGLSRAAVTEVVSSGPGGGLLLHGLLHNTTQNGERVVLIDGKNSFIPKGLPQRSLTPLLWIRCREAWEALKAADLIIRDGNVPLVILLLTLNPSSELRRIPATAWHRLQMLAEKSGVTVMIFSPHAQVGCARLRLSVSGIFPLAKLHRCRLELMPLLRLHVERRRMGHDRKADEEIRRPIYA